MLNLIKIPNIKSLDLISKSILFKKESNKCPSKHRFFFKRSRKLKCCSDEIRDIFSSLSDAFVNDEKRPQIFSLPVLQRFGKLELIKKTNKIQLPQKTNLNEISHEFRFLSLKKKTSNPKKSLYISLGLNNEDNFLDNNIIFSNKKKNTSNIKNLKENTKTSLNLHLKSYKLILSTFVSRKLSISQKLIFTILLTLMAYLSSV